VSDLKTDKMRSVHGELVGRIAHQQRKFGMLPDIKAATDYIAAEKIMEKTEATHVPRPTPSDPVPAEEVTALGRKRGPDFGGAQVTTKALDDATMRRLQHAGDDSTKRILRRRIKFLATMPEWAARMNAIVFDPDSTETRNGRLVLNAKGRESLRRVYEDSERVFGDPLKTRDKRIQVG
jgi:hypothetical protein